MNDQPPKCTRNAIRVGELPQDIADAIAKTEPPAESAQFNAEYPLPVEAGTMDGLRQQIHDGDTSGAPLDGPTTMADLLAEADADIKN